MTSNGASPDPTESFEIPRSLKTWPYATRQLLQMPHPEIVEGHARNLLSRALNIGRLTAFVGSGASMAYGRISWIDMLYTAQEAVRARYSANENKIAKAEEQAHIKILYNLLDQHKIERDSNVHVSSQLAVFQLSEELDKALDAALSKTDEGKSGSTFRETIMWVTRDERGHAEQLLKDAFLDRDVPELPAQEQVDSKTIEKKVRSILWGRENLPPKDQYFLPWDSCLETQLKQKLEEKFPSALGDKTAADILSSLKEFLHSPLRRYQLAAQLRSLPKEKRVAVLDILKEAFTQRRTESKERGKTHSVQYLPSS